MDEAPKIIGKEGEEATKEEVSEFQKNLSEKKYRIRKLTEIECGRLMGVSDENIVRMIISNHEQAEKFLQNLKDYGIKCIGKREMDDAKRIRKMSGTQLYKQFGNSIVVPVLMAIFSQMHIEGVKPWNEMSEDEIYRLIDENK